MFIILDERDQKHFRRAHDDQYGKVNIQLLQLAEYVVVLKNETYEVIKDRFENTLGEFPIEEMPDVIKDKLVYRLKIRDQVHTDEE